MSRRDPSNAPKGPAAQSATEALLNGLQHYDTDVIADTSQISGTSQMSSTSQTSSTSEISDTSTKYKMDEESRIPRRGRGRPKLPAEERLNHVKTTFSLDPDTKELIERLRAVPALYSGGIPSKSDVVAHAIRHLAEELNVSQK